MGDHITLCLRLSHFGALVEVSESFGKNHPLLCGSWACTKEPNLLPLPPQPASPSLCHRRRRPLGEAYATNGGGGALSPSVVAATLFRWLQLQKGWHAACRPDLEVTQLFSRWHSSCGLYRVERGDAPSRACTSRAQRCWVTSMPAKLGGRSWWWPV
jgi:hypothetical protein